MLATQESRKRYEEWLQAENTERDDEGHLVGAQYPNWSGLCFGFNHAHAGFGPNLERVQADQKLLAEYRYYVTQGGWLLWQALESAIAARACRPMVEALEEIRQRSGYESDIEIICDAALAAHREVTP